MSEFRRRLMMVGGGSGPDTYDAEVEYVTIGETQYIKLPIKPSEATDAMEIISLLTKDGGGSTYWSTTSNSDNTCRLQCGANIAYNYFINNSSKDLYGNRQPSIGKNFIHTLKLDYKNTQGVVDGQAYPLSGTSSRESSNDFTLFRTFNTSPTIAGRVYSFKYWRNNILVFDLIPVRKDGVGYLFDTINSKLYGDESGGNLTASYDKISDITQYTAIDYINVANYNVAPRGQIYTGIVTRPSKIVMEVDCTFTAGLGLREMGMGCNTGPLFGVGTDKIFYGSGSLDGTTAVNNTRYTITTPAFQDNDVSPAKVGIIKFFCSYNPSDTASTALGWIGRLYGAKIWVDDVLARDYVPRQHPSGAKGLFDKVENKFYPSGTTSNF